MNLLYYVFGNIAGTSLMMTFMLWFRWKPFTTWIKNIMFRSLSQFKSYRRKVGGKWEFILYRWGCRCHYRNCACRWFENGTWVQVTEFTKPELCHSRRVWSVEDYTNNTPRYISPHIYR